jgi:DNA uptake protein ComE-like DNA-binding protein
MKSNVVIGALLAAAFLTTGCVVREGKYIEAVAEADTAKTELEKTRAQKSALEQQMKALKDANAKMSADAEFISAELQRIKDSREKERSSIEGRTKELEQKVKDLSGQHRALRQEYEDVKKLNETLKATVARYQKELKERDRASAMPSQPFTPRPPSAAPSPGVQAPKPPSFSSTPQPEPSASAPQLPMPVNINSASTADLVLFLGLTREMADRIVANRPYKVKGELVAKNVVPKETFDGLKDRITVSP